MRPEAQRILDLHLPGRRSFVYGAQALVNGERVPGPQPAEAAVHFGALDFNPASGNQGEEYIQLVNPQSLSVDISGWQLDGAVQFTFKPGTVLPAGSHIYLSPDVKAFRARTTGVRGGQGLYVQGNYSGQLSARGESLWINDPSGRRVAATNYPGSPTLAQQWLRITEIMYHPAEPPPDSPFDDEAFEFIELQNTGPDPLPLRGLRFDRGIAFEFADGEISELTPGDIIVVVKNLAAFRSRYGLGARIAGVYSGTLDNAGEVLRLEDGAGEVVAEFTYSPLWHPLTDGKGAALELRDEAEALESPDHWQANSLAGGTPGRHGATVPEIVSATASGTGLVIHLRTQPGEVYSLWHRTDLSIGTWELVQTVPAPGEPGLLPVFIQPPADGACHFYRIGREQAGR
jgi:hypothetical protein